MPAAILGSSPRPILPAVAWAAYKVIATQKSKGIGTEEIQAFLIPPPLREEHGRPESVEAALGLLTDTGLVGRSGDRFKVKSSLSKDTSASAFRNTLRHSLLEPAANKRLLASDDGPRELTKAVAWFLCQPVAEPIDAYEGAGRTTTAVSRLNSQFDDEMRQLILKSSNRWGPFLRWARYLGFIAPSPRANGGYIPDPTQAVRDTLPALGRKVRKPIPITYFVSALAEALPVLDGGSYRAAVEKAMAAPPQSVGDAGEYSQSLSYALRRLAERGTLELLPEADAPDTRSLPVTSIDRYPIVRVRVRGEDE